jgi:peptidoglycan/xylan/chitin deacetylase (PgdA/CDA1 family)
MPTSLALLVVALTVLQADEFTWSHGGIIRGNLEEPVLALVFTGDEYGDGTAHIREVLDRQEINGSFFFTGRFYRNPDFADDIRGLAADGHYLGAHSDQHLLYCSWENRDSLLVTRDEFVKDVLDNYTEMARFGVKAEDASFFMPAYEWYNDRISAWTNELGLTLINYSPGTRSHADYTTPDLDHYISSDAILQSIVSHEAKDGHDLNGFILLSHVGTAPERTDKFYLRLDELITFLKRRGYRFQRIDELLSRSGA